MDTSFYLKHVLIFFFVLRIDFTFAENEENIENLLQKAEANIVVNQKLASNLLVTANDLITQQGFDNYKPHLFNLQSHLLILSSKFNEAFEKAKDAEITAQLQSNKLQEAEALRRQGIISYFLGFNADAIELLTKSLKTHQELNSDYLLNNLQSIGNVYATNPYWSESLIEVGELLVEKAIEKNNFYYEDEGYSFIAAGLIKQGKYEEARSVAEQAEQSLNTKQNNVSYYAALATLKLGDSVSALQQIEEYNQFVEVNKTKLTTLASNLLKTEIFFSLNENDVAIDLLVESLEIADEAGFFLYQTDALQQLTTYFEKIGDFEKALDYYQQYIELKEKEFNDKQAKQLAFSRARLELEQKNQKITELELTNELTTQQNQYQLFIILLVGSILILLLILYWRLSGQKHLLFVQSEELKQATEAKSQFLARMSHEIRTPINAIIGLTKLTQKQKLTAQQQQVNLQQIEDSSNTLLGVINDILDFSKIEAGKLNIESLPFEIDKVLDQATRLQTLKAHPKGLELVQYIAHDVPLYLRGDMLRVQQILNNLISNAVKFTNEGVVSVSLSKKYSESGVLLEFAVKDTGIGLSEEQIAHLFTSFSQADESTTRQFGGTGLGLAICKELVELMGGKIWVESRPGQGSTFYFTILAEEENVPHPNKEVPGIKLSDLRVLVVDDVELCRQAAAEVLLRVNINPDLVDSGATAIEKVRLSMHDKAPYDLILLDWKMPDIDGIEVASIINQEFTANKPKIAMLSAYDMQSLQELCKPLGVTRFLEKPINTSSLIEMVTEVTHEYRPKILKPEPKTLEVLDLSHLNILLVEDNSLNLKVAKGFLSETNVQLSIAENGQIALDILAQTPEAFDLVLMDVQMPVMDGYTATQKIRNELNLSLPVVAMTANAMKSDKEKCTAAGMDAHIPKPIDPDNLMRVLKEMLSEKLSKPSRDHHSNNDKAVAPENTQTTSDTPDIPDLNDQRLLLVEDNRMERKVAIRFLAESDAHISVAKSGEDAIEMLRDKPDGYDLIFMDVQMPGIDGIETTRFIRKELDLDLPIIAMTAGKSNEEVEASLSAGMNAYVTKPINSDELYKVLSEFGTKNEHSESGGFPETSLDNSVPESVVSARDLALLIELDVPLALEKLEGNQELYQGLVEDFVAMEPHIHALGEALEKKDFKNIKLIIHTFKSGLAYIGANNLSQLGTQIEIDIQDSNNKLTPALLNAMHIYQQAILKLNSTLK